uniref:Uncharacterized protein n=1 Tax=Cacopsylla melanoneura TaxID=428564 RepID=A0A8D8PQL4_9HEMI
MFLLLIITLRFRIGKGVVKEKEIKLYTIISYSYLDYCISCPGIEPRKKHEFLLFIYLKKYLFLASPSDCSGQLDQGLHSGIVPPKAGRVVTGHPIDTSAQVYPSYYSGSYAHAVADIKVLPSGYLADTPEVALAKSAHFAEKAKASTAAAASPDTGDYPAYPSSPCKFTDAKNRAHVISLRHGGPARGLPKVAPLQHRDRMLYLTFPARCSLRGTIWKMYVAARWSPGGTTLTVSIALS